MARPKNTTPDSPASEAMPTEPETIHVRVIFNAPLGMFRSSPGQPKDPGRYAAGRYWSAEELNEADVTLEQLTELEADSYLDVQYDGKASPVAHEPPTLSLEKRVAELEQMLRDADRRVIEAEQSAREAVRIDFVRERDQHAKDLRALEARAKRAEQELADSGKPRREGDPPRYFPGGPAYVSPDETERSNAARDA